MRYCIIDCGRSAAMKGAIAKLIGRNGSFKVETRTVGASEPFSCRGALAREKRSGTKIFLRRVRLEKSSTDVFQSPSGKWFVLSGLRMFF